MPFYDKNEETITDAVIGCLIVVMVSVVVVALVVLLSR